MRARSISFKRNQNPHQSLDIGDYRILKDGDMFKSNITLYYDIIATSPQAFDEWGYTLQKNIQDGPAIYKNDTFIIDAIDDTDDDTDSIYCSFIKTQNIHASGISFSVNDWTKFQKYFELI